MKGVRPRPLDREKVLRALRDNRLADYDLTEVAWRVPPRLAEGQRVVARHKETSAQEKAFDQVWVRPSVFEAVANVWGLTRPRPAVYDPAAGTGAAWASLRSRVHLTGLDLEPEVAAIAETVHPNALIRNADFAAYRPLGQFDLAGGAPPYRCSTLDRGGRYYSAGEAGFGPSHGYYIEQCLTALRDGGLALFVLPRNWHRLRPERAVVKAAERQGTLVARIQLPDGALSDGSAADLYVYARGLTSDGVRCTVAWVHEWTDLPATLQALLDPERDTADGLRRALEAYRDAPTAVDQPVAIQPLPTQEIGAPDVSLPMTDTVEARIIPNGNRVVVKPNGRQAAIRLANLDRSSGRVYDAKRQRHTTRWKELLREPWGFSGPAIVRSLRDAGLTPVMTTDQVTRLERRQRWAEIQRTPFEQWVRNDDGEWVEAFAEDGLRSRFPDLYAENRARLERLGFDKVLYPYQMDDVARLAMKNRVELASDVGTGKSIEFIAYVLTRNISNAAIVCNSRLVGKWIDEIEFWQEKMPHLADRMTYQVVEGLADVGDLEDGRLRNFDKLDAARFTILTYESLWRIPKDSCHYGKDQHTTRMVRVKPRKKGEPEKEVEKRFWHPAKYSLAAELGRAFANGAIMADEAYRLKDMDAKQTSAFFLLDARCRIAASATMIRNYIDDLLPILTWLYGDQGVLFPRFSLWSEGGAARFIDRYATFVFYRYRDPKRSDTRKMLPKVANADEFRQWHAPMQLRRVREEPEVRAHAGAAEPTVRHESIALSEEHRQFYSRLQDEFLVWWQEYLKEQEKKGRQVNPSLVLAKLGVLQRASTCPSMESLTIDGNASITYDGGLTSKMARAIELCRMHVERGEKVVLFGQYKQGLRQLRDEIEDLNPVMISGDVSLSRSKRTGKSKRDREIDAFRSDPDRAVMIATQKSMTEGYDLYEANVAIFVESDWTPSIDKQALGRLRRPQQTRPVVAYFLTHSGTVDEYVTLISGAKDAAHAEALDGVTYALRLDMIPDVQDYANGILDGLRLDQIKPSRRIARIRMGDVELFNEERDGRLKDLDDVERVFSRASRLSRVA